MACLGCLACPHTCRLCTYWVDRMVACRWLRRAVSHVVFCFDREPPGGMPSSIKTMNPTIDPGQTIASDCRQGKSLHRTVGFAFLFFTPAMTLPTSWVCLHGVTWRTETSAMGFIEGFSGAPPHPTRPTPINVNSAIVSEDIGWIDLQLTNVVLLEVSARIADEQSRPAKALFVIFAALLHSCLGGHCR